MKYFRLIVSILFISINSLILTAQSGSKIITTEEGKNIINPLIDGWLEAEEIYYQNQILNFDKAIGDILTVIGKKSIDELLTAPFTEDPTYSYGSHEALKFYYKKELLIKSHKFNVDYLKSTKDNLKEYNDTFVKIYVYKRDDKNHIILTDLSGNLLFDSIKAHIELGF